MSTTYHSLASGNLTQNWSNAGLITTNDDWSGVPSITGYLGDIDAGTPTNVDPRTLTGANPGAVDVIANATNPATNTSGGVAEFAIPDPTVALQGSGTADAPSLVLYLDASGREGIRVQFNARDIDAAADDAQQQLNVQYRVGPSGAWTNVGNGYFADVTTGGTATQVTAVDVTLPAAANNQGQVEVRIMTTNAGGSDEWVGIDDIVVSSVAFTGGGDTTAPVLQSSTPADDATGIVVSSDIVLNFDEAVRAGTGDIVISDGAADIRTITLGGADIDGTVTFNGNQVVINLASNLNPNTTYNVTFAAGVIEDAVGNDHAGLAAGALNFTTRPAPAAITPIFTIQGAGHTSALAGQAVATEGVVTAVASNGFYIQAAIGDGNAATSDGIFVFTGSAPSVIVGHLVQVEGTVTEFIDAAAAPGSLSITEITSPVVTDLGVGASIVATQIGGSAGLKPPTSNLDDDGLTTFDPVNDGLDFFESLEGMLVRVDNPVAVSPTNSFGEIFTIVDNDDNAANGLNTNSQTVRGGVGITGGQPSFGNTNTVGGDFNPERIQIDDGIAGPSPSVSVGAVLGDVTGVMSYGFGNYEVIATQAYSVVTPSTLTPEVTALAGTANRLTIANYNVENLDPSDGAAKFNTLAQQIVTNLKAPDILALQEVQDNNGATNDTTTSAAITLQMLVDAIKAASGNTVEYAFQDNPFIGDDLNGGEPGGNIRVAFLYRVDRGVDLVESSLRTIDASGAATTAVGGNSGADHPFFSSRPPLVADFTFKGETITVIDNHFSSKTGSGALMGAQPPINSAEPARAAQAQAVNTYVDSLLATNPDARVVVSGDLNEFEFEEPMQVLSGKATYLDGPDADSLPEYTVGGTEVLLSMSDTLPLNQRYDYVFDGSSQSLDQMYVTNAARAGAQYDIVHMNAEFANQASDHDALVASFDMTADLSTTSTGALHIEVKGTLALAGAEISAFDPGSDRLFVTSNAGLQVVSLADPAAPALITTLNFTTLGFGSTDVTSVAVKNGIVAVALLATDKAQPGHVIFINAATNTVMGSVQVGVHPDMVTFTPDGKKVLVANEGEVLNSGLAGNDGEGTVSIIDITGGVASATVQTADFTAFNGQKAALLAQGVRIFGDRTVSKDVEPEYIAISPDGTKAMVTLQEANALAILDIATATFTSIVPLGLKDWTGLQLDVSDQDGGINLVTDSHLFGMYMPDAISAYTVGGQTYYVMANEGDDRDDFLAPDETIRVSNANYDLDNGLFPNEAAIKANAELGRHTVSNAPGLRGDTDGDGDIDQILTYGARSFSIVDSQGNRVFDSADVIERIIAQQFPSAFDDSRSDNKGPEPEGITIGKVGDKTFAFVALERANMTLAFDITDPGHVSYAGAARNVGDVAPEGILFIPAADSPTGEDLLITSNETSNTLTVFEVSEVPAFTLQLLHFSDGEAGLLAADTAPYLAALLDAFDDDFASTLILAGGDNFLPGPFINAGTDPSLNGVAGIGATAPGRPDLAMLNALGVDASTIGNHEFDLGSTAFRDAFTPSGAWVGAQFPYLSANLDFSGDSALNPRFTNTVDGDPSTPIAEANTLKGRIAPAAVVTENGQKIGLVAATTQLIESISSPNGTEVKGFPTGPGANGEVDNMDLLAAQLQPIINEMIAQGVNKIVLMSHLQQIANEQLLATKLHGVDIILSAGSNTRLGDADDEAVAFPGHEATFANTYPIVTQGTDGKTTVIVNTDGEYTYLGRLVVGFDAEGDIILDTLVDNRAINGAYASTAANVAEAWGTTVGNLETTAFANGTKGDQVRDITQAVDAVISAKDGNVYGYTDVYLEGERAFIRSQETNLGDLSADSGIFALKEALGAAADDLFIVGLRNGGGIRAQIGSIDHNGDKVAPVANPDAGKAEGGVSQLDVENSLRFDNKLMVFDTTAAGLKAILEHSVAAGINQGRFGQIGGVQFSWDPDNAAGSKILSMALVDGDGHVLANLVQNGTVLANVPSVITVSTTSFTANGGDGYPIKANGENFRFLLNDGTLGPAVDEALDFTVPANTPANAMGEQAALADYLQTFHGTSATAYDKADTVESLDTRIQNVNVRTDTVLDTAGPTLVSSNPADDATGIGAGANIVLTFSEAVEAGTGEIIVTNGAGDVRVITVGTSDADGTVTFNGSQMVINLATDLALNTAYDVIVQAGAVEDAAGNDFAGIAMNQLDFTTAAAPLYMLQLLHFSDGEAGLLAGDTAHNMAALIDAFDDDFANTLILSSGDNFLPGPFINAGTDPSLNNVPGIGATAPGRPDIAMLNAMGVEASAIGNHEFDLGSTVFRDAFTPAGTWQGALFPYLSANLDFSGDSALSARFTNTVDGNGATPIAEANTLKGRIAPATVLIEGGQKIGLVAATTQILESISSPNGTEVKGFPTGAGPNGEVDNMDLLAQQLQPIIDEMIAEGINKIILTSHLQQISNEQLLATKLKGVDIIISGGSNTRLGDANDTAVAFPGHAASFDNTYPIVTQGADGKTTMIVNTDGEYTYLGRLAVGFDANGEIVLNSLDNTINGAYASTAANVAAAWGVTQAQLEATAFADGTKGDQVRDITRAVDAVISAKDGNIYGYTDVYLEGERAFIRSQETNLGDLSADTGIFALKEALGAAAAGQFIVGLRNGGGIRAQIGSIDHNGDKVAPVANPDAGKAEGGVSQLDVENALRFDNKLMAFDTTAAGLKAILEHSVAAGLNQGRFAQVGGLRFSWDPDFAAGSRVMNIALVDQSDRVIARILENGVVAAGAPAVITVSTTSFTANGGDGYPIKANGSNFRFLLADGSLGPAVDEALDFTLAANVPANAMGEQAAFADYMHTFHGSTATAYDDVDTAESLDVRIQNLNSRSDGVFADTGGDPTTPPGPGDDTIAGTAGPDTINAGAGNDTVSGKGGADIIDLGSGADVMRDTVNDLNGDRISGFGMSDVLDIMGTRYERGQMSFNIQGSQTVVTIGDKSFALVGDFTQGDFMTVSRGTGANMHTIVTFEPLLPTLNEGVRVDPTKINGVTNELFLSGDGLTNFTFEFKSGVSAHSNTLGYYKIAANGTISDVHVLIDNTLNVPASARTVNLGTLADGQKFGFFLVQDGFDAYGRLPDNLSFVTPGTTSPTDIDTGVPPVLRSASLGNLNNALVFHSVATLNPGDANQVLSGVSRGGLELLMGFEDLPSATGDNDFQDVIFSVRTDDLLV